MRKLILVIFIFAGCSKEDKGTTSITVLETVTNLPVSGATVSVTSGDPRIAPSFRIHFTGVTDDNGICKVPSKKYNDALNMSIEKAKYWNYKYPKSTTVHVIPEGWLQLRLHQVGNYPVGSKPVLISLLSESGGLNQEIPYMIFADSLYTLRAFGLEKNRINWGVIDAGNNLIASGQLTGLQIPRFDTLKNVTLDY